MDIARHLPTLANRAERDGIPHHGHQTLCPRDGGGEQLSVGQETKVQSLVPGLAGVASPHRGENDHTELFA